MKYFTARIDIKNFGTHENNLEIIRISDYSADIYNPTWFKDNKGQGKLIESNEGILNLELKCIKSGLLKIWLRGIDCMDKNNHRFPIFIDFIKFEINNENLINKNTLVWHDEPYVHEKKVEDSEIIKIHIEWKPFNNSSEYNNQINNLKHKVSDLESKIKSIPQLSCISQGNTAFNGKIIYRNWRSAFSTRTLMDDFNGFCEQEWFTRYLKHKFPNEDFKINFFGPFERHYNLAWPMEGKKVFYTGENLNFHFPEMREKFDKYALDYVDLSMGFDLINDVKYLRFPFWAWYQFSPEVTEEEIERNIDMWNSLNYKKARDVVNVSSHDHWNARCIIADDVEKIVRVTYGGKWRNNTRELWEKYKNNKKAFIKQYRFNICPENTMSDGYVTEKIFDSIRCDCIPLYAGGGNYLEPEIINPNAILKWDLSPNADNSDTIELFKNLYLDERTYKEFKDQDILLKSSKKHIIDLFSDLKRHFERLIFE